MRKIVLSPAVLVVGCAVACLTGCTVFPWFPGRSQRPIGQTEGSLTEVPITGSPFPAAATARISDIPVPEGMKMQYEHSFVFENGVFQIAYLIYEAHMTPEDAVQFFIDSLPRAGWTLLNVLEYNDITVKFTKPDKDLLVQVSPKFRGCLTRISLTPKRGTK